MTFAFPVLDIQLYFIEKSSFTAWAKLFQSSLTLYDPTDCSLLGSSVHGILQARILKCIAMPSSRGFPDPWIKPAFLRSVTLAGMFFTTSATWNCGLFSNVPTLGRSRHTDR